MPSSINTIVTGPGRIHIDVVSAAAELFNSTTSSAVSNVTDALSQTLAVPVFKTYTAAVGGDATQILASGDGPFYVGDNVGDLLPDLFSVVDAATDAQIFNSHTRQYVVVSGISASVGAGFVTSSITLTFNTPVPPSLQYKVYYGRRATLESLPVELASNPVIRRTPDRVRFPEFDRTGYAPTSISNEIDYTGLDGYPDPYLAQWKAVLKGNTASAPDIGKSGAMGFVHVGSKQNVADVNDVTLANAAGAGFLAVVEKDLRDTVLGPGLIAVPYTKINSTFQAVVQNNDQVLLNAGDYFRLTGPHRTAIRIGVDMLEITFSNGYKGVYLMNNFDPSNVRLATVRTFGGDNPNFPNDANVRVKWIRPTFFASGSENETASVALEGFGALMAGAITNSPHLEIPQTAPFFCAGTVDPARASSATWNIKALTWGAFDETSSAVSSLGLKDIKGELWGDGTVQSFGGRIVGLHTSRSRTYGVNGDTSDGIDPTLSSQIRYNFTGASAKVLTLSMSPNYIPQEGDRLTIYIQLTDTGANRIGSSVVWPSIFKFSETDNIIQTTSSAATAVYEKFEGDYVNGFFFFTRTDFEI